MAFLSSLFETKLSRIYNKGTNQPEQKQQALIITKKNFTIFTTFALVSAALAAYTAKKN